jgi:uncharacterized protein with HEPN domain
MVRRSPAERLLDIRAAATDLRDIVADMKTDAFHALPHANRMAYRAVKNALAELGEAVKALPVDVRKRHPEVDWKGFAGLRDLVAHQYFGIDTSQLLPIIRDELPGLLTAVESEVQRELSSGTNSG